MSIHVLPEFSVTRSGLVLISIAHVSECVFFGCVPERLAGCKHLGFGGVSPETIKWTCHSPGLSHTPPLLHLWPLGVVIAEEMGFIFVLYLCVCLCECI